MPNEKLPLHRKYRPTDFNNIYGNEVAIKSIKKKIDKATTTTFLLKGPRGCGKTTLARIMAKSLNAHSQDIIEMDLAEIGVKDKARQLKRDCQYVTLSGGPRVFIFDEIQDASKSGFQPAILKLLEEPPKNTYFILCTTDPQKLLPTIKSRCLQLSVKLLDRKNSEKLIKDVCKKEEFAITSKEIRKIIEKSGGNPRETLILIDSIKDLDDVDDRLALLENDAEINQPILELCRALVKKAPWKDICKIIKSIKQDPESVRLAIRGYFSAIMLNGKPDPAWQVIECFDEKYVDKAGLVTMCYMATQFDR